ncbi:3,4-dihydroxy-2-butanone 4-phosphate synthase / GTP cyclohydrolase II [Pseudonocardia sp. Ae168_Ps1]|nr:3,4-dihydroxy-2-butanone 4-phosphate synthase / GTP cyclohydrolase II [Pseudonocardia sp. Ae150A_Ps1]OLL82535.1 3,4-dihydroxy-2-butanone 4-phosphate synthase / GTP cyclohydrolase II [Pseudonocardia sp. Ae168_Ps1]OLL83351.1 3,4-dihydroxy-2-butanone 4-phosphate synthase / GTP cyclohydrolase II [Pseudonocardia sp. Ae263_Ps1]OLL90611.1 3,4-dihydroxy-2-butanone 4-phosphate synthase / GTP cyclohydrolase II [Pseudonocardia sp. Ae356_Ps1]
MSARAGTLLRLAAGVALLGVLVVQVGAGPVLERLRDLDARTVLAAVVLGALGTACTAWRWCLTARGLGLHLAWPGAFADCYRASFLNSVLPSGVLGDVHRAVSHGRRAGDVGGGVRAVVLERLAAQLVLVVVAVAVLVAQPDLLRAVGALVPGGAVWAAAAAVVVLVVAGRLLRDRLGGLLGDVRALLRARTAAAVLLASAGSLACHLAVFVLAARVAGSVAGVAELLPLLVLALLAMALPLNVGGWGPREAVAVAAFAAVGLPAAEGLATAVVYGVLALIGCVPGGLVVAWRRRTGVTPAPGSPGPERPEVVAEPGDQGVQHGPALPLGRQRGPTDDARPGVGLQPEREHVRPLVGVVVGAGEPGPDDVRPGVQQDRRLQLAGVHVGGVAGDQAACGPGGHPVVATGEQRHGQWPGRGLLDDVAQHVVPAVPVDQHQRRDARRAQRGGDVADDRGQRGGGDAHRPGPGGVLVRAGDRDRGQDPDGVLLSEPRGQRRRDDGVGVERQVRPVLLVAADGQQRRDDGPVLHVHGGLGREKMHADEVSTGPPADEGEAVHDPHRDGPAEVAESQLTTRHGTFRAVAFREHPGGPEHLALVLGDPAEVPEVLVRMHSECLTGDVFGARRCECGAQLASALDAVAAAGCGVIVYLRGHEGRGIGLLAKIRTHTLQDDDGLDTVDSAVALGLPVDVRDFGAAAVALRYLGVDRVRLLSNNPEKASALTGNGITVTELVPLLEPVDEHNVRYLTAKRDRLGHHLPQLDGTGP